MITITELLSLDPMAERTSTQELVDGIRLNVPGVATTKTQAAMVLTLLGRDPEEAWDHVRYCVTGHWRNTG
jgi:hypothetical protein